MIKSHRTHVICGGCFIDKDPLRYNNNDGNDDKKQDEARGIVPLNSSVVEWIKYLCIGDIVDCCDTQDKWYECVIRLIEFKDNNMIIYVHYIGWNKKWDEGIIANNIERVAKRNTFTKGPHRPRRPSESNYRSININSHYPNFKVTPSQYKPAQFGLPFVPSVTRVPPPQQPQPQLQDDNDDDGGVENDPFATDDEDTNEQDSSHDVNNDENVNNDEAVNNDDQDRVFVGENEEDLTEKD